ncbi:MAG: phosphatidate cytidylyltransferase [bacterium]|nr:phosphatidate cytidylyltransferase [Candidatus Kapabacteria bacterium]
MNTNAYYITQLTIVIALVMVSASASGCETIGNIFQAGMIVGILGLALVVGAVVWLVRKARK